MRFRAIHFLCLVALLGLATAARAGSATNLYGLYYTGVDNNYGLLGDGVQDSHWQVTYARVNGTGYTVFNGADTNTGQAYTVSGSYIDGAWVDNSSTSRWITAPGARTAQTGGTANAGGDYLPGNGTTGDNSAYYVYRLAFTITGSTAGGSQVNNKISISLTIAADDAYYVYVNPNVGATTGVTVNNNGTINAGGTAASATGLAAWDNTTAITLNNYGTGPSNNADFVIGTNYLYIVVANTNSQTGDNGSTALNPSGLLVYQVGSAVTIDGKPVPEVGTLLPLAAALGLFGWRRLKRRTEPAGAV